jgi:prepilin-type processing-associated H-X9-DG protein
MHLSRRTSGGVFFAAPVIHCLLLAVPVVLLFLAPSSARADYTTVVNPNSVLVNNFQGWGTSLCWWANVIGNYPNRTNYVDLAFTQLKLNIARYNIGGGENPTNHFLAYRAQMPGFEPASGVWNWNADLNQRWVLQAARARGVNLVDAFANSPPWWMTVSASVTGAVGATNNLQVADQVLFAAYLANVVSNLTVLDGDHFDYVTPMNEPNGSKWTYGNTQEGCNMSQAQQPTVVNDLRAALNLSLPAAGIDAAEDVDPYQSYSDLNAYSSTARNNLNLCTTHTYSETGNSTLASQARSLGKPLWVAEYGDNDGTGLTMAQRIHDDITGMDACAWVYWQFVDSAAGWGFLLNPLVAPTNSSFTTSYTINKKFYAMGQFSEFVRPGCQIISAGDAYTLAAYTSTNSTLVLVMVNTNSSGLNVTYNLADFGSRSWQVTATQTSASENLAALPAFIVTSQSFTAAIPAKSVTTFVLTTNFAAPTIISQAPIPSAVQLFPGKTAAFSVTATGSVPLYYQWLQNGSVISGATNANYLPPNDTLALNNATSFDCLVSNSIGSVTSQVWSVSIVSVPTAPYAQAVLALNPAGYWPMHEVTAGAPGDIETNHGTLGVLGTAYYPDYQVNSGAFIRRLPGALANDPDASVFFNASSPGGGAATNGLFVPHTSPLTTLVPPFTLECWVLGTNHVALGVAGGDVLSQADGTKNQGFRLYDQNGTNANGTPSFSYTAIFYKAGATTQLNFNGGLATNQWHHLVVTCDGNSNVVTYTDGTQSTPGNGSSSGSIAGKYLPETHQPFTIGTGLGNIRAERDIIDEVAFYPTNLAASDISQHYNDGVSGSAGVYFQDVTNDHPLIYLRMDGSPYSAAPVGTWPALMNYGQTNGVATGNGVYTPGTMPGAVNGIDYLNFPLGLTGTPVAQLSGVSSFADAGYAAAYNPIGKAPFTISAFFRGNPTDTNRVQSIVGHGTNSWELGVTVGGAIVFNSGTNSAAVVATGTGAGDLVSATTAYDDGNWHQVVAVHNGTTNVLYVDGVANKTDVLGAANNIGNSSDVMIGSDPSYTNTPVGLGRQFAGQVCEVALFTNALTSAQVQTLYSAGVSWPAAGLTIGNIGGGQMELNWSYGTLQSAPNAAGPYADLTNAVSPYTIPATNAQQFYRTREN